MKKIKSLIPLLISTTVAPTACLSGCCKTATTIVVTLYADKGSFNDSKYLVLSNVHSGTCLKDIKGYLEPYLDDEGFRGWLDDKGNLISSDTKIKSSILLKATYNSDYPYPVKNFETDPWITVCSYANQGLDKLCEVYKCSPASFIGKKRVINVNGVDHKVMVVGVNNETYTKNNVDYFAALTFQFDNFISDGDGGLVTVSLENEADKNYDYWNSNMHKSFNGIITDQKESNDSKSVFRMIYESNPEWASNIKNVRRTHNISLKPEEKDVPWQTLTKNERIFSLTMANYFSPVGIRNSIAIEIPFRLKDVDLLCAEGKQYQYYAQPNMIGDQPFFDDQETRFSCLTHYDCYGTTHDYCFSTPLFSNESHTWGVHINQDSSANNEGYFYWRNPTNVAYPIVPGFCI